MKTTQELQPGDSAYLYTRNFGSRLVLIEKVGSKNLFVQGNKKPFERETGRCKDGYGDMRLQTVEQYEHDTRMQTARKRITDFGLIIQLGTSDEKILAIEAALAPLIDASKGNGPEVWCQRT